MNRSEKLKQLTSKTLIDDVVMTILALFSVCLLAFELTTDLTSMQENFIIKADTAIALVFLLEWLMRLSFAKEKKRFVKSYWWELLASIPVTTNATQALRAIRLLRVIRVVRLGARVSQIAQASKQLAKYSYLITISVVFLSVSFASSLAFNVFEKGVNPNVHNLWDSFWWSIVTATTIGYGDIYPQTTGGRITAIFLMMFGIGSLGVLTANVANTLIKQNKDNDQNS